MPSQQECGNQQHSADIVPFISDCLDMITDIVLVSLARLLESLAHLYNLVVRLKM